jgi:hypothetical protein
LQRDHSGSRVALLQTRVGGRPHLPTLTVSSIIICSDPAVYQSFLYLARSDCRLSTKINDHPRISGPASWVGRVEAGRLPGSYRAKRTRKLNVGRMLVDLQLCKWKLKKMQISEVQETEIELLKTMYPDDFAVLDDDIDYDFPRAFAIDVRARNSGSVRLILAIK